ncbi:MAG: hypothetical protein ACO31I_17185 [Prochlorotrichaceae cyanobacterium]|jgi:hypothetical protein
MLQYVKTVLQSARVGLTPVLLPLGVSVLMGMQPLPAIAEALFIYANTPTTDSLVTFSGSDRFARVEIEPSGWWTIQWRDGQQVRFQFIDANLAQVEDDRIADTVVKASYEQEFLPSTGEFRYTLRHDRGEFSFLVVATDGPGYIDREVMLAEQEESGLQLVGNFE